MKSFIPLSIMLTLLLILIILFGFYIYSKIPKTTHLSKIETMTVKPHYSLSFQGVQQAKQSYTLYYEPSLGIGSDILVKITRLYLKIHPYLNIIIHTSKTYSCKRNFYLQYNTQIKYPPITSTNKFNYLMIYSIYNNNFKHAFMLLLRSSHCTSAFPFKISY